VRTLGLLEALAAVDEIGIVELAARVDLRPSTAHRLLVTLVQCGYVRQNPENSRYRLSHKVVELAGGSDRRIARVRAAARSHLEATQALTGETTNLTILDGRMIVYVDQVEGSRPVRMFTEIGRRVPAHATGAGKAMLAMLPANVIAPLMASAPFQRMTPHTLVDADELAEELERVRTRGYAIDNEEYDEGVVCVAAPILDYASAVTAAISVSGPAVRMHELDLASVGSTLRSAAAALSRELGYTSLSLAE
jgi:IclR family acetate operon transcriptional repressor